MTPCYMAQLKTFMPRQQSMARTSRSSAPNLSISDDLKVFLTKRYKLPDMGEVEWYLDMEFNRADEV